MEGQRLPPLGPRRTATRSGTKTFLGLQSPRDSVATFDSISDEAESTLLSMSHAFDLEVNPSDLHQVDMQGLDWSQSEQTRLQYRMARDRETRLKHSHPGCADLRRDCDVYAFGYMNKSELNTIHHPQLRHLLKAPTSDSVFFNYLNRIKRWNPLTNRSEIFLDLTHLGMQQAYVSTIASVGSTHVYVGGFYGEVVYKRFGMDPLVKHLPNAGIVNYIHAINQGEVLVATNDCEIRRLIGMSVGETFTFPCAINAIAQQERDLLFLVGDCNELMFYDIRTKGLGHLKGHSAACFAVVCHGHLLASASEDNTVKIWDIRKYDDPFYTLTTLASPARSLSFIPPMNSAVTMPLLAIAETCDYVHVTDLRNLKNVQTFDFFGEIGGLDVGPCGRNIYIGITGASGGILQLDRIKDSIFAKHMDLFR